MRLIPFTVVQIQREDQKLLVSKVEVVVNPERVCMVSPATIPSDLAGPDGTPVGKPAAALDFGGYPVLVDCPKEEAIEKLTGTANLVEE